MFNHAATDPLITDKTTYTTIVRTSPAFSKMAGAVLSLTRHFDWHRVVIVSQRIRMRNNFCDYAARGVESLFRAEGMMVADWMIVDTVITAAKTKEVLSRIRQRGRGQYYANKVHKFQCIAFITSLFCLLLLSLHLLLLCSSHFSCRCCCSCCSCRC